MAAPAKRRCPLRLAAADRAMAWPLGPIVPGGRWSERLASGSRLVAWFARRPALALLPPRRGPPDAACVYEARHQRRLMRAWTLPQALPPHRLRLRHQSRLRADRHRCANTSIWSVWPDRCGNASGCPEASSQSAPTSKCLPPARHVRPRCQRQERTKHSEWKALLLSPFPLASHVIVSPSNHRLAAPLPQVPDRFKKYCSENVLSGRGLHNFL
jgi:hypothetical protein